MLRCNLPARGYVYFLLLLFSLNVCTIVTFVFWRCSIYVYILLSSIYQVFIIDSSIPIAGLYACFLMFFMHDSGNIEPMLGGRVDSIN